MKLYIFSILFIILGLQTLAQNTLDRELKYWYLRDRLKYFIVQSDVPHWEEGSQMVMMTRGRNWPAENQFSDKADYGQQSQLFGKYIGLLATEYFLLTHYGRTAEAEKTDEELIKALQAHWRRDFYGDSYLGYPPDNNGFFVRTDVPLNYPDHSGNQNEMIINHPELNEYDGLLIDADKLLVPNQNGNGFNVFPVHSAFQENDDVYEDMSIDEAIYTLEGLALAYHFGSPTAQGTARWDAYDILERLWNNGLWTIWGPDNIPVNQGYDAKILSWGLIWVAQYFGYYGYAAAPGSEEMWRQFIYFFGGADTPNDHMIGTLEAIGNVFYPNAHVAINNATDGPGFPEYYLWLYRALQDDFHDYNVMHIDAVEARLDEMPCEGPWRKSGSFAASRWCEPDHWSYDDSYWNGGGQDAITGVFSGIDYMSLLNLYWISSVVGCDECSKYWNMDKSIVSDSWPSGTEGTIQNPKSINSFRSITSTEQIKNTPLLADVSYYAGKEILLEPGFDVQPGAHFLAHIQKMNYCQNKMNRFDSIPNTNNQTKVTDKEMVSRKVMSTNEFDYIMNVSSNIQIFPNPTKGVVNILSDINDLTEIKIYSASGIEVSNYSKSMSHRFSLDLSMLSSGVYTFKFITHDQIFTRMVIKI